MASSGNRIKIRLVNSDTGTEYYTTKNRINTQEKIEKKKFDPKTGKHETFKEKKISKGK
jgi:ribosomal protein L33